MRPRLLVVVIVLLACWAEAAPATAAPRPAVDKVLIVAVPRLTWQVVADEQPPALMQLLTRSAVASMSLRTVGARTTLGRGYATLGAGNRASVLDLTAGLAFDTADPVEGTTAAATYRRRTDRDPTGRVLELGLASSERRNRRLLYGSRLGELGSALGRAGRRTAVIANADGASETSPVPDRGFHREAAFAMMDRDGQVDGGTVSDGLLAADPAAPFGLRLDPDRVDAAFTAAWAANDVVLLELSDLERADAYGDVASTTARRQLKTDALAHDDRILARTLAAIDPARTLVIVVTPAAPRTAEQLGVAGVAGPGIAPGMARSPSTRRAGYVTLPDVAPTALNALGLSTPHAMSGTTITSNGGAAPSAKTASRLATDNVRAIFRDKATGPVSVVFVVLQVLVYAAAALALSNPGRRRARTGVAYAALVVLAIPLLGFLSGLVRYDRLGVSGYLAALVGGAALVAGGAWALGRRRPLLAPGVLIASVFLLLIVDVGLGGRLQLNTVFGYSPIVAGRFAGFGNLAYGLLAITAIGTATIAWALANGTRRAVWAVVAVLLVALVVDGAPPWGSDVGGVLASGPAFMVVVASLTGRRIGWRRIAFTMAATAAALVTFALIDLARPASTRTHLGRLAANPGDLGDVVRRKLESNLHILTSSVWTLIIPVALAFVVFLAIRPPGLLRSIQSHVPGLRACLLGGLVAGLLGFAVNDSGVAVPAIMLAVFLPYLTYLLTRNAVP